MRNRAWRAAVVLSALTIAGCSSKSPLDRLLADLESRIEDRDAAAVVELLAPEFQAQNGMKPAMVVEELKRYFFAYESLDVQLSEVAPEGDPPRRVSVRVDMSGKPKQIGGLAGMVPDLAAYRFDLDLVPKDDALRISGARWERVDRTGP